MSAERPTIEKPEGDIPFELVTEDLVVGDGEEATSGAKVSVHYVGVAFRSGEEFDASWERGKPFEFRLGKGQVIPGWDAGVARNAGRRAAEADDSLGARVRRARRRRRRDRTERTARVRGRPARRRLSCASRRGRRSSRPGRAAPAAAAAPAAVSRSRHAHDTITSPGTARRATGGGAMPGGSHPHWTVTNVCGKCHLGAELGGLGLRWRWIAARSPRERGAGSGSPLRRGDSSARGPSRRSRRRIRRGRQAVAGAPMPPDSTLGFFLGPRCGRLGRARCAC